MTETNRGTKLNVTWSQGQELDDGIQPWLSFPPDPADKSNHWPVSCPGACRPAGPWCSAKHQNVCKSWTGRRPAAPGDEKSKNQDSTCSSSSSKQSKTPELFHSFLKTMTALVSEGEKSAIYECSFVDISRINVLDCYLHTPLCNCLPLRFQGLSRWWAHQFLVCVCVSVCMRAL